MSPIFRCVAVSMTDTERPTQFVTYAFVPSLLNATSIGSSGLPKSIFRVIFPVAGSITMTVWPGGSSS